MTPIVPDALDLGVGAALIVIEALLSLFLGLGIHRPMLVAAVRMVVQLLLVGVALRFIFALASPWLTLLAVVVMASVAAREVAVRPRARLRRFGNYRVSAVAVMSVT
ncbi:MAG: ABC transporter permease, partial [Pseudomonadota bacterium]|nr:ABC transporter permease [Pseudomonadota bacterium]